MCFKTKTPKLPGRPRVLSPQEADLRAEDEIRRRLRGRRGRGATILTSALGDPDFAAGSNKLRLLSGGG